MASERVCFFHRVSCGSMLGKLQTCPFFANPSAARSRDGCVVVASRWCTAGWQHLVAIVPFGSNGFTVTGVAIDECSPCSSDEQMSNQNGLFPACLSFLGFLRRRESVFPCVVKMFQTVLSSPIFTSPLPSKDQPLTKCQRLHQARASHSMRAFRSSRQINKDLEPMKINRGTRAVLRSTHWPSFGAG